MDIFSQSDYISWALALAGVIATTYFFFKSRIYKKIHFITSVNTSVLDVKEPIPELKVFYKDHEIDQLYVLEFEIINSGKKDLSKEDFIEPLQCSLGAQVVDARRVSQYPKSCDLDVDKYEGDTVAFKTVLFKANEKATFKLRLLDKPTLDLSKNRVVDLKRIQTFSQQRIGIRSLFGISLTALAVGITFFIYSQSLLQKSELRIRISDKNVLAEEILKGDLAATYKGIPIRDIHLTSIIFFNTGNHCCPVNNFMISDSYS